MKNKDVDFLCEQQAILNTITYVRLEVAIIS
jgi:hypothetical protein